jgi:hypothetical protein
MLLVLLAACGGAAHPRPTEGSIGGLVRDRASGDPVAMAEIQVAGHETRSASDGLYSIDHLRPGRYTMHAHFAGQPITIRNIDVKAGDATFVDVTFTLGNPESIDVDFGDPTQGAIKRYYPKQLSPSLALIDGTVSELGTRMRIVGAVVTAEGPGGPQAALQTVTDDQGRYRFDNIAPGTYAVSAYYSVGGRGQIEVRRSDIEVAGAEHVEIPIWIELSKQ